MAHACIFLENAAPSAHGGDAQTQGYYNPYPGQSGTIDYDDIPGVRPRGLAYNQWLTRLFKCQPSAKQRGWLRVGSPQVYSRQLVYRDRAEEIQFLSDRLKATKEFHLKYQGAMDARYYAALATDLALNFDPGTGKLLDQTQANSLQVLRQNAQVEDAQHQIDLLNLQQRLVAAQLNLKKLEAETPGATVPQPSQDDKARQDIATLNGEIAQLKDKISKLEKVPHVANEANAMVPPTVTDGNKPSSEVLSKGGGGTTTKTADQVSLTAIEEEKSILEIRRFLQNERRRLSFDDMHDASGSTVLELGMLVTLMPPEDEDQYAVLEISVEKPDGKDDEDYDYDHLMDRWAQHLGPAIKFERDFMAVRYQADADAPHTYNNLPYTEKLMDIAANLVSQETNSGATYTSPPKTSTGALPMAAETGAAKPQEDPALAPRALPAETPRSVNPLLGKSYMVQNSAARANIGDKLEKFVRNNPAAVQQVRALWNTSAGGGGDKPLIIVQGSTPEGVPTLTPNTPAPTTAAPPLDLDRVLEKYLELYYGSEFMREFKNYTQNSRPASSNARTLFRKFLNWSDKGVKVLAVDPAEQGQNISMVGATQSIRDSVMSLNAMLSGGVKGSARSDYYRDSQLYMQSINRKPLAVGFVNGAIPEPSFGWILGPRFEVEMKRRWFQLGFLGEKRPTPVFQHEPTSHQVQVVISLPTWIPKVMLKVKAHWVSKRTGLPSTRIQTPCVVTDDLNLLYPGLLTDPKECAARIPVVLEPDFTALTEGLLDNVHGKRRPPRIFMQYASEKFTLTSEGDQHHLVLLGKDLWRSPTVYLDSLPADSVDVMPGLCGIVATFKGSLPASEDPYYSVTVSTHGGFDTIKNVVTSPVKAQEAASKKQGPVTPLLSLKTSRLDYDFTAATPADLDIRFNVDKNPFPFPLANILKAKLNPYRGTLSTDGALDSISADKVRMSVAGGANLKNWLASMIDPGTSPSILKVTTNLVMPYINPVTEGIDQADVIVGPRHVYLARSTSRFETKEPAQAITLTATAEVAKLDFTSGTKAEMTYFLEAYPEFAEAYKNSTLQLQLTNGDKKKTFPATAANSLNFRLPTLAEAAALGLQGTPAATITVAPSLIVPGGLTLPVSGTFSLAKLATPP